MKRYIVLIALTAMVAAFCAGPVCADWSFVHITDMHVDTTGADVAGANFGSMITLIKGMSPAPKFVLAGGDVVDHGMIKQSTANLYPDSASWRCAVRKLSAKTNNTYYAGIPPSIPIYFTPGNHDSRHETHWPGPYRLAGYDYYIGYNSTSKPRAPSNVANSCTTGTGTASRDYYFTYTNGSSKALVISMFTGYDAGYDFFNPSSDGMSVEQLTFLSTTLKNHQTYSPKIILLHNPAADTCGTLIDGTQVGWEYVYGIPDDGCFNNRHDWFRAVLDSFPATISGTTYYPVVFQGHVEQNVVCDRNGRIRDRNWTGGTRYVQTAGCRDGAYRVTTITTASPYFASVGAPQVKPSNPSVSICAPYEGSKWPSYALINVLAKAQDANKISKVEISVNGTLAKTLTSQPYAANVIVPEANQNCVIRAKAYDLLGYSNTASVIINGGISTNAYYDRLNVGSSKNINCPKCKGVMTVTFNEIRINSNNQKRQVDLTHSCGCGGWSTLVDAGQAYRLGGGQTGLFVYPARIFDSVGLRCSDIMIAPYQYPTLDIITPMAGQQTNICEVMLATNYSGNDVQWSNAGAAAPVIDGALKLITYTYNGSSASTPNDEFIWNMSSGSSNPRTLYVKIKDGFGTEITKSVSVQYNSSLSYLVYRGEFGDSWTHPTRAEAPSWISCWNISSSYPVNSSFNFWSGSDPYGTHWGGGAEFKSKDALISSFACYINCALTSTAPAGSLPIIVVNRSQYNSDTLAGSKDCVFGRITWKEIYNELARQMGTDPASGKYRVWASTSVGTRSSADAISDPFPPTISMLTLNGTVARTQPYQCWAYASDNIGVTIVKFVNMTNGIWTTATYNASAGAYCANVPLNIGDNLVLAFADDASGQRTATPMITVKYNPVKSDSVKPALPKVTRLTPCTPNPVSGPVTVFYQLSSPAVISLKIYNISGQLVKTLIDGTKPAGYYNAAWDCKDERGNKVAAGSYFYRMDARLSQGSGGQAGSYSAVKKMMVIK